jgi:hypothetical protein
MRWGVWTRGLALALLLGACVGATAPAGAVARRPTRLPTPSKAKGKGKLGPAPNCAAFEGSVSGFALGQLKGPSVTSFGSHHTTCVWSGQAAGMYAFVVSVAVFAAPAEVGKALLAAAETAARRANTTQGGFGLVTSRSPRRGNYFEGEAVYDLEESNKDTEQCPAVFGEEGIVLERKNAIEKEQTGPSCAGQPGTEGDFLTAYGSPVGGHGRAPIEPMILQISVACQLDALSGGVLHLAHIASAVYGGRGY